MLIRCGYEITLSCTQPIPMVCVLDLHDDRKADLQFESGIQTAPQIPLRLYRDHFGNDCRRFVAPAGDTTLRNEAVIFDSGLLDPVVPAAQEIPIADLPDDSLMFLVGSRYCETDKLSQIAWDLFGHLQSGWGRVQAICDFVHQRIEFGYPFARSTRTAMEAYEERIGVCRDFAHLALTFCRCMNIPARYVNGYLGDIGVPADPAPMDFSAWIEVYLSGHWYTFDARHNVPRIGRIVVARGRDAADIPLINSFGPHILKQFTVWAEEETGAQPTRLSAAHPLSGDGLQSSLVLQERHGS
jgi:transglutaminase-like putative cysteine protease